MDRISRIKAKVLDRHDFMLDGFKPLWKGER
jgi:hypothetical protein